MTTTTRRRHAYALSSSRPLLILTAALMSLTFALHTTAAAPSDAAATATTATGAAVAADTDLIYGVNFMSAAEDRILGHRTPDSIERQYQNGLATGATWNRWPMYWFSIEQTPGSYTWPFHDQTVSADLAHGLNINAILLGTPGFYLTGAQAGAAPTIAPPPGRLALRATERATPQGVYEPVFTDGTGIPGPGKQINPANKWALFVFTIVNRYKPGGVLAQMEAWPAGVGVTHWEMWNEPDLDIFWDGTLPDYARLLKAGYLAAKQADPAAQVLFGALANNFNKLDYYNDVMAIYDGDGDAGQFDYFHDIVATHSYFYAWQSWFHVFRAGNTLASRNLDKPIWLNETGVRAWNDYPGPTWDPSSGLSATLQEQADYTIQTAFYAAAGGADAIFHFQLYDGCGNQALGSNFPPHNGELCTADGKLKSNPSLDCAGDANGLYRNPTDAACFTQHPAPETPRLNLAAFQLLTTHLTDVEPLPRSRPGGSNPVDGPQEWVPFFKPSTGERILGLWARFGQAQTAQVPATGDGQALLIGPDGAGQTVSASDGVFEIALPGATNLNAPWDPEFHAIGGRPYLLIETDTQAPAVSISAAVVAPDSIHVTWLASDEGSSVASYDLDLSINSGVPFPWLEATTETSATYTGVPGRAYTFIVTARDKAGNVSYPQAASAFLLDLPEKNYAPLIHRIP